ncbi:hypothetical protein DFJ77DRAFT_354148 [Powellomyces hirtus]|nr:hypothetical protein DFJ77DRAFT_354148 [Powellomyces hirtus]
MSSYEEENILLVATLPRSEIYGVIDKARHRSTAVSVGIMAGMSLLVSALFVVAVLPLFKLAREMAQLTKLDFGTLEESGALEQRSFLWELRKVQATFATMVKAFAGAIKKNKEMQSTRGAGQNSRTTGTDHGGGGGGRVASQAGPPVQSTRALVDK